MFADHGYHGSRVADIARDAGVAHGLLYHYFASKEDVLRTIFAENWGQLIGRFRAIEAADEPARQKLEGVAKTLLRTWRNDPALVTVMVREVARSQHIQGQVEEVGNLWEQDRVLRERRQPRLRQPLRIAAFAFGSLATGQDGVPARFVTELAAGQAARGHEAHVFVPAFDGFHAPLPH